MKKAPLLLLFLSFSILSFSQNSHIQVVADPGIRIFLNGTFRGITSSDVGGLIISNLSAGTYRIKAQKDGFQPQEESIYVKSGEVKTFKLRPFAARISITESGNTEEQYLSQATGKLKIQSLPVSINIQIPTLGVNYRKQKDEWMANELPEGFYDVTFTWNNKRLTEEVEIIEDELTHIFVDMINSRIEYRRRPGPIGSLKVTSKPVGSVRIGSKYMGRTPYSDTEMRPGNYKAEVSVTLDKSEYLVNQFTMSKDFQIRNNRLTTLNFNVFDEYDFGLLNVASTEKYTPFTIKKLGKSKYSSGNTGYTYYNYGNKSNESTYNHTTDFKSTLVAGNYEISIPQYSEVKQFSVEKDKTTDILITPPEAMLKSVPLKTLRDVSDYKPFNSYYQAMYTPLPESRYGKKLEYDWLNGSLFDYPTIWGIWTVAHYIVGMVGWGFLLSSEGDDDWVLIGLGLIGGGAVMRHVIAPLDIRSVKKPLESNIAKNNKNKKFYQEQYNLLLNNDWMKKLQDINAPIHQQNREIETKNREIEKRNSQMEVIKIK